MEEGGPVDYTESGIDRSAVIELANRDDVYKYITKVNTLVQELENLLHEAPPLRFSTKQGPRNA